ncbi:M16 family metallopeptidase [Moraxella bovoculi]|uniref:M16 family metallopeptidase n=1 Tax=Moraxella bovoculi TaxID=386891 RepID=UPI003F502726
MKIKYLTFGILLSMTSLAHASDHAATTPIDFSQPLPKLDSLENIKQAEFHLPSFERFQAAGNVPVIFTKLDSLPMVDISVEFRAGSAHDGKIRPDAQGIANMTATLLTKGTKTLDEEAFLLKRDSLGIQLDAGAGKDSFGVSLRSLSDEETLNDALDLMKQMLTEPAFDESVLARNKETLKNTLRQNEQNPNYIANRTYTQALFKDHPYGTLTTGDIESVDQLTRNDLNTYMDKFLVRQNATITITGNLSQERARQIANDIASSLPNGTASSAIATPTNPTKAHIHVPHDSTQTSIIIGHLAPKFATNEQEFIQKTQFGLANNALAGSSFNARLMDEIREKRGYTYGIYGRSTSLKNAGSYQISFSTASNQTINAINDTLQVVNDTISQGIGEDELNLVKNQQTHRYPMSFASNAAIHGIATTLNLHNLPDSYATDEIKRIQSTELDEANQALKSTIKPDDFIIVTVGQDKPDLSHLFQE